LAGQALENIALEATKSGETISLYRIENKNIEKEPDGITSHKDFNGFRQIWKLHFMENI
jgi:hypothetical protein